MSKPTLRPWVALNNKVADPINADELPTIAVCQRVGGYGHKWPTGTPEANAKLIVQCVNAHDELVEALAYLERNAANAMVFLPHALLIDAVEKAQKVLAKLKETDE